MGILAPGKASGATNRSLNMRYRFTARSAEGETKTGFLEALDPTDARQQLERRKLRMLQLHPEEAPAPVHVTPKAESRARPVSPRPTREPGLWAQIDRRKTAGSLVLLMVGLGIIFWLGKRMLGQGLYQIQLSGHLTLISKQELDPGYMDRVQLGLRLQNPAWQINRDGTIEEKGRDGKYHRIGEKADVNFQSTVDGDYQFQAQVDLPAPPASVIFFVEAPGFTDRWMEARLAVDKNPAVLVGTVQPMTVKRTKRRDSIVGLPQASPTAAPPPPSRPKYNSDAPEPLE